MIIDTHAHYDDESFNADRDEVISSLPAQNIAAAVTMGADLPGCRDSVKLSQKYPFIYCGVGLHPDHVGKLNDASAAELYELAKTSKCVCIGEIGLDYHWNIEPREVQISGFREQIHIAQELGLPFNVHSRNAAQDTFDVIKEEDHGRTGGIIHCFSGSREMAREYIKMGYYLGIGGAVTYKNSRTLKKVVEDTPLEYLVTETDCPYLAPTPHRGERNSSLFLPYVVEEIALLKSISKEEVEDVTIKNAEKLFGIKIG